MTSVGTLNEKPLHAALKRAYAEPGDRLEVAVERYVVDIMRGPQIIEIQTRNFAALKAKLTALLERYDVLLVTPVAVEKRIVKLPKDDEPAPPARRSPKHGTMVDVFDELVSFPHLVAHPRFSLEVALISEEEVRRWDPTRAWRRRGWVTDHRRLVSIVDRVRIEGAVDLANLIPAELPEPFTTADLAGTLGRPRRLAQRMAYCLRVVDAIVPVGKSGNALRYARAEPG